MRRLNYLLATIAVPCVNDFDAPAYHQAVLVPGEQFGVVALGSWWAGWQVGIT